MYSKENSKVTVDQLKAHLKSLKKDNVGVEEYRGKYRLNIAKKYSRLYFKDENSNPLGQKRVATGLSVLDGKGKIDKANADTIAFRVTHMHNDLMHGNFDPTLVKYGFLGAIPKDEPEAKKQKSLLELYDWYCESRKELIADTTLKIAYQGYYKSALVKALEAGNIEALNIQNYLINNVSLQIAIRILSALERAYNLGMKHGECDNNPFAGMASEIRLSKQSKSKANNDNDGDDDKRAFTLEEMNAIIEAFETSGYRKHYAPIIKFLFWTGCRTGEAIGIEWQDINWKREKIFIRRTYNEKLKLSKETKTRVKRWVPMPKDGRLWNLLKSLPEGKPDEVVFKAKGGGIVRYSALAKGWMGNDITRQPGVINQLIAQGKVSQYLKLYATRHTFITHQIQIHKVPPETVAQWCGHDEQMTKKTYLDKDRHTMPGELTTSTPNQLLADKLANLTPEQIDKLMSLLN